MQEHGSRRAIVSAEQLLIDEVIISGKGSDIPRHTFPTTCEALNADVERKIFEAGGINHIEGVERARKDQKLATSLAGAT